MTKQAGITGLLLAWLAAVGAADELAFTSTIDVNADCNEVYTTLTEFGRLQKLVPHLNGTANIPRATKLGDALFYELVRKDGTKNTGKFIVTALDPAYKLQVMVQPDEGPWLRVQEFTLYEGRAKGAKAKAESESDDDDDEEDEKKSKGRKAASARNRCHVEYQESFNPLAFKFKDYDSSAFVEDTREPYMEIILRRLKNISEGKEPGPRGEAEKLREVAKNFP